MSVTARWLVGSTLVGVAVVVGLAVWLWPVLAMVGDPRSIGKSYYIPSEAMLPTLAVGDTVRPLAPDAVRLTRGTIVIFDNLTTVRVSRIVAVGGDVVAMRAGHLSVNGMPVVLKAAGKGPTLSDGTSTQIELERLPGESGVHRLLNAETSGRDEVEQVKVPPGRLYVLGDDRDRSADSRFPVDELGVGFVPVDHVIGIVDRVLWSRTFGDRGRPVDQVAPSSRLQDVP